MAAQGKALSTGQASGSLRTIHWLLGAQSLLIVLLSINRLSSVTQAYVAANEFLRWLDLLNMIVLPLLSMIASYLLLHHLESGERAASTRVQLAVNLLFFVGVYWLAASYGDHEVTNYMHGRFCPDSDTSTICRIISFNDDEFSHWVFFTGFVLVNAAVLFMQLVFPHRGRLTTADKALLVVNGLFIAAGIIANLAFEPIELDLYVVAILMLLSLALLWRRGAQPLIIYYATAYTVGLIVTFVYKALHG